jgi:hypothetical protein
MNDEALALTRTTGKMHYWSRSRNDLEGDFGNFRGDWLLTDCDEMPCSRVEQGVVCHMGIYSCFARPIHQRARFVELGCLEQRKAAGCESSYTCKLMNNRTCC